MCERLYAFGFEVMGVCVGVRLKGMYFCEPSMPVGLLLEWVCRVLDREGGCVYCCALVWMCMVGTVFGAEYVEEATGLAGWSALGTLVVFTLEGSTLEG